MSEVKRPKRGKEAAANDDTDVAEAGAIDHEALFKKARFNPEKLIGEVGDFLLSDMKASRDLKPWNKLPEHEQRNLIDRARGQSREIVFKIAEALLSKGFQHLDGVLEDSGSFKDGMFTLKCSVPMNTENALLLSRRSGQVQIVFASAKEYESEMATTAQPDQAPLIGDDAEPEGDEAEADAPVFDQTDAGKAAKGKPPTR